MLQEEAYVLAGTEQICFLRITQVPNQNLEQQTQHQWQDCRAALFFLLQCF
jgi:hypothetical protein